MVVPKIIQVQVIYDWFQSLFRQILQIRFLKSHLKFVFFFVLTWFKIRTNQFGGLMSFKLCFLKNNSSVFFKFLGKFL